MEKGDDNEKLISKKIENIKTHVRRVLKEHEMYSSEMSYQIELLASDLLVFRKIRDEVLKEEQTPTVTEKSREGEDRIRENPIYNLMAKFADRLRKDLRSLMMNKELAPTESKGDEGNDALTQLMDSLKEE
jgi:hypothetical protein|nr:MAG TPA: hypothetical protein [Caudoviricetes sp.]